MRLEIVSHCWRYSRLLRYQLSSLFLHPPQRVAVTAIVFCASPEEDPETARVLDFFCARSTASVAVRPWTLDRRLLFRRAIGRNLAARSTTADVVWFADCDMAFGDGALDSLDGVLCERDELLFFPREIWIHRTHALGDLAIQRAEQVGGLIDVHHGDFERIGYGCAIGGVQIVPADVARRNGYCPHPPWQFPADRWQQAREDVVFRRVLGTPGTPIDVPNVFRLRHSQNGRSTENVRL